MKEMDENLVVWGYAFVPAQALHGQFVGFGGGHAWSSRSFVQVGAAAKEGLVVMVSCLFGRH